MVPASMHPCTQPGWLRMRDGFWKTGFRKTEFWKTGFRKTEQKDGTFLVRCSYLEKQMGQTDVGQCFFRFVFCLFCVFLVLNISGVTGVFMVDKDSNLQLKVRFGSGSGEPHSHITYQIYHDFHTDSYPCIRIGGPVDCMGGPIECLPEPSK